MAPPPSQKGKFKPRKPPKKIKPGASASAAAPAATETTSASTPTVAFAPSTYAGRGGAAGRGGRGRGAGRGRGRGRAPIPSGKVFFTAAEKTSTAASRKKVTPTTRIRNKEKDSTEEVVGQLETAIGQSSKSGGGDNDKRSALDSMDYEDQDGEPQRSGGRGAPLVEGAMYDSDSSQEEEGRRGRVKRSTIRPFELPFPTESLPLGVGSSKRLAAYDVPDPKSEAASVPSANILPVQEATEAQASPFVDAHRKKDLLWEQNSWFIMQLPTRLPPLKPNTPNVPLFSTDGDDEAKEEATSSNEISPMASISEVVTQPVVATNFDNTLSHTAAGKLGKIIVYKSGKTVLVMEGPEGSKIRMNVNEGLSCGFLQQAVAIDPDQGKYVCMGEVKKSIVVSPDFDSAFSVH